MAFKMNLVWHKTSRNTSIATFVNRNGVKLLYKKSKLIRLHPIQINEVQRKFEAVIKKIKNLHTPKFYEHLSDDCILVFDFIEYPTLHEQMARTIGPDGLNKICEIMFETLEKIHASSVEEEKDNPYALIDYGPKNIMHDGLNCYIIDLPDRIVRRKGYWDYGVLWFEIDRSLFQTKNAKYFFRLVFKKIKLAKKNRLRLWQLICGVARHSFFVASRYLNFFKDDKITNLLLKFVLFVPGVLIYFIVIVTSSSLVWMFLEREPS